MWTIDAGDEVRALPYKTVLFYRLSESRLEGPQGPLWHARACSRMTAFFVRRSGTTLYTNTIISDLPVLLTLWEDTVSGSSSSEVDVGLSKVSFYLHTTSLF